MMRCGEFLVVMPVSDLLKSWYLSKLLTHRIPSLEARTLQHILMKTFPLLKFFSSELLLLLCVPRKHLVTVFQVVKMAKLLQDTGGVI